MAKTAEAVTGASERSRREPLRVDPAKHRTSQAQPITYSNRLAIPLADEPCPIAASQIRQQGPQCSCLRSPSTCLKAAQL
jgi:hypothetical protein